MSIPWRPRTWVIVRIISTIVIRIMDMVLFRRTRFYILSYTLKTSSQDRFMQTRNTRTETIRSNSFRARRKTSRYCSILWSSISCLVVFPSQIWTILLSVWMGISVSDVYMVKVLTSLLNWGLLKLFSKPMLLYPSTRPIPSIEGIRYLTEPSFLSMTYSRSIIVWICWAMVASVPACNSWK